MKRNFVFERIALLIVLGLASHQLEAQTNIEVLFARVRDAITTQEIGWQLTSQKTDAQDGYFSQVWGNRAEEIHLLCVELASPSEASEWLSSIPLRVSISGAKALPDVGDEALIYGAHLAVSGSAVIYFRKAAVTVQVDAPSEQMAIRVARLVADQVY